MRPTATAAKAKKYNQSTWKHKFTSERNMVVFVFVLIKIKKQRITIWMKPFHGMQRYELEQPTYLM